MTIHPTANTATATITDDAADAMTATVAGSAATVAEGSNAVFTVTLSGGTSTAPAVVRYETTGTATSGRDYTAPSGSLTIAAGVSTGTVTIAATADTVLDRGETLGLRLTGVSGGGGSSRLGVPATATTTITDSGAVTVGFSAASASVAEGRAATLTVSLSGTVSAPVTVKWKTADGTAGSADYTAQAATALTIAAGATAKTVTVRTAQDLLAEGGETFTASLETDSANPLPAGVSLGTSSATVTIADDESLLVDVSADAESVAEGGSAAYTVTVTGGTSTAPVVVSYETGGTATAADDYTAPSGSLTVASGQATAAITIATATDTVLDPDETLSVTLTGVSGGGGAANLGTGTRAETTLTDAGSVTVSLDPTSRSVAEGSPARFKAVLSGTVARDVVVSWTTAAGGTAISGTDYTAQAATSLTIAAGATSSGAFTVATAADTLSEGDETFQVRITADSGAPLPSNVSISPTANTATATITDDAADAMTATVARVAAAVAEGSDAVFTVTLSGGTSTAPVVVSYETSGSTTSATDYTAPSGSLTIAAGVSTGTVTIATTADTVLDRGETLGLRLTGLSGGGGSSRLGVPGDGDDHDHRFRHRDGGRLGDLGERRRGPGGEAHRVAVGDGVGRRGGEVEDGGRDGRECGLHHAGGDFADHCGGRDELHGVHGGDDGGHPVGGQRDLPGRDRGRLGQPVAGRGVAGHVERDGDDHRRCGGRADRDGGEQRGDGGGGLERGVYGDALGRHEHRAGGGELRDLGERDVGDGLHRAVGVADIAAGVATGTVTIAITADTVLDRGETLSLTLTGVSGGGGSSSLGAAKSAETTITDSGTVTVGFSAASASVAEGRTARLTVSLSGTVSDDVTVKWKTAAGSAVSGTDYTAQAATAVTIAAGATSKTVTVQTAQDRLPRAARPSPRAWRRTTPTRCRPGCRWARRARR